MVSPTYVNVRERQKRVTIAVTCRSEHPPGPWPARQSVLYCRDQRRRASPWPCRNRFSRHPASAPAVLAGRRDISTDWRRLDIDCAPGGDRGSAYIRTGWARRGSRNRVLLACRIQRCRLPRAFAFSGPRHSFPHRRNLQHRPAGFQVLHAVRLRASFSSLMLVKLSPFDATFVHAALSVLTTTTPVSAGSHRGLRMLLPDTPLGPVALLVGPACSPVGPDIETCRSRLSSVQVR